LDPRLDPGVTARGGTQRYAAAKLRVLEDAHLQAIAVLNGTSRY
jgi:hypothetical protein